MKKVLLVTLQGDNLGNRLQNYALQEILKKENCEVWTPYTYIVEYNSVKKRIKNYIKSCLYLVGKKQYKDKFYRLMRIIRFTQFDKKYISNRFRINYKDAFSKINTQRFDYAITGSDQVWHKWSDDKFELRYFYLDFVSRDKRLSYAPSFGFDEFPEQDKELHRTLISKISKLSCREKDAVKMIKDLTNRDAELVLDPTLLLDRADWERIMHRSILYHDKKYILIYFLGKKDDDYIREINKVASKENLEIIDVFDKDKLYSMMTTPDEFIWLVDNASYICTDSFHATVFSILFKKKFLVFKRKEKGMEKMFNRIETLLEMFGLNNRVYSDNIEELYAEYKEKNIDGMKRSSLEYLRKAIGNV